MKYEVTGREWVALKKQILHKIICILLACVLVFTAAFPAFAGTPAENAHLHFNADGKFRILNFSDIQDDETLDSRVKSFIRRAVYDARPDLIALTGDNIYGPDVASGKTSVAIAEFMDIFEELGIPVAIVFGNHDDDDNISKEQQMQMYSSYSVNISYDEGSSMDGCGTYNVPIYGSTDRNKVKFNLWMFDTGSSINNAVSSQYDYMRASQLNWYVSKSNELKAANGGVPVPSIAFQHIIVNEIYDALQEVSSGGVSHNGKHYTLPSTASPDSVLGEHPCPSSNANETEFAVLKQQGDVIAIVSGHDHKNMFVVPHQGIDLINTPAAGFYETKLPIIGTVIYSGDPATRGARIIDVDEETGSYTTSMLILRDLEQPQYYSPTNAQLNTLSLRETCFNADKLLKNLPEVYSENSLAALQDALAQADVILQDLDNDNRTSVYDQTALNAAVQQIRTCMENLLTASFTVTFDANGGTCAEQSRTIVYGAAVGELPTAQRERYLLDGWFTEREGGELITANTIFTDMSDRTLYAHWVKDSNWRIPGDINLDETVDLRDVVLIQRYLVGDLTNNYPLKINVANADVDGSGTVNLRDVMLLRRYIAGGWLVVLI